MEVKSFFAQDSQGNIIPGATCTVFIAGTAAPAVDLIDRDGAALTNPFQAGDNGEIEFGAPDGDYDIRVTSAGKQQIIRAQFNDVGTTVKYQELAAPGGAGMVGFQQSGVGAVARTLESKSREVITPEDFGAIGDGVADDTAAVRVAMTASKIVKITNTYRVVVNAAEGGITSQNNATIYGGGTLLGENTDPSGQVSVLVLGDGSNCDGINIAPYNTDSSRTDNTSLTVKDGDSNASFNYNSKLIGVDIGNNCVVNNVTIKMLWRGFSASGKKNIRVTNSVTYQIGVWHAQFYDCEGVQYTANTALYGGSSGGLAFSSSKKLIINNNYCKLVGTGINTGGSSSAGFNVEDVVISGNNVIARDCINLENGAVRYTVAGNKVSILKDYDLAGTNGNGIANTSESGGAFQGLIGDGTISSNEISSYDGLYSFGIRIGTIRENSSVLESFSITGNVIKGAEEGVRIHNDLGTTKIRGIIISGNIVKSHSRGIRLINSENVNIIENNIATLGSTVISNYYGITLSNYNLVYCNNNVISGFGYAFRLESDGTNPSNAILTNNNYHPNEQNGGTQIGNIETDSNYVTTRYFISGRVVDSTINSTRVTLRGEYVRYQPGQSVTWNLLGYNSYREGQVITVEFDGYTTVQNSSPYILTRGGVSVTPANGQTITFSAYSGSNLKEISRNF